MNYLIQVCLFQIVFLLIYDLFLSKETFFQKNRVYLIASLASSFVIPLLKFSTLKEVVVTEYAVVLPEIVLSPGATIEKTSLGQMMFNQSVPIWTILFYVGLSIACILFLIKLFKILRLITVSSVEIFSEYKIVRLKNSSAAFSFFNYVFLGDRISAEKRPKIQEHELVHVRQRHSWDLLFFEGLKIIMWFNPLIYAFQKRMSLLHEYQSDAKMVQKTQKNRYVDHLLSSIFDVENISFINQFYKQSLIKKRITMMTKEKSKRWNQWKYLLILPLLAGMLLYSACSGGGQLANEGLNMDFKTIYNSRDGELTSIKLNTKSAFDVYFGPVYPFKKQIGIDQLTIAELQEYEITVGREVVRNSEIEKFDVQLHEMDNGRKVIAHFLKDESAIPKINVASIRDVGEQKDPSTVAFVLIEQIPTFPGCEKNDKKCFNSNMQKHFATNFNGVLVKTLGLSKGKKRIITTFEINTNGVIENISVRAPAKALEEETKRVAELLPKMLPGMQKGKPVKVKYTLPLAVWAE